MRFFMSISVATAAMALTFSTVLAKTEEHPDFAKHQVDLMADIDGHIAALQQMKACVGKSANEDGIKKCREVKEAKERKLHAKHETAK